MSVRVTIWCHLVDRAVVGVDKPIPVNYLGLGGCKAFSLGSQLGEEAVLRRDTGQPGELGISLIGRRSDQEASRTERANRSRAKRVFDLVIASLVFVVVIPLLAVIALGIKSDSPGPVLYRSRRVGRGGREFTMLKFRKMREDVGGSALTAAGDERLTGFGSLLRRAKLDELPQLWNVVRGDMSLVGPRPEDPRFVELYPDEFTRVLEVRPGITGLSQLAFAQEARVLDKPDPVRHYVESLLPQKLALDELYIASRSIAMDLRIIVWTLLTVVLRVDVSVNRKNGWLTVRRRQGLVSHPVAWDTRLTSEESSP